MIKQDTLHILLAGKEPDSFGAFRRELSKDRRLRITAAYTAEHSYKAIHDGRADVVVVADELQDKNGLQFVREIVADHPFINCALVSPLYPREFHEQTEGLGLFMQLPVNPGPEAAKQMLVMLEKLNQLHRTTEETGSSNDN